MRKKKSCLLSVIVFLTFTSIAWACSCYFSPSPADAYKRHDVIFIGEVVKVNLRVHTHDKPSILIIKVIRDFKGDLSEGEEVELFDPICPYIFFKEGEKYLVYTGKNGNGLLRWPTECSSTQGYSEDNYSADIQFLENIKQ